MLWRCGGKPEGPAGEPQDQGNQKCRSVLPPWLAPFWLPRASCSRRPRRRPPPGSGQRKQAGARAAARLAIRIELPARGACQLWRVAVARARQGPRGQHELRQIRGHHRRRTLRGDHRRVLVHQQHEPAMETTTQSVSKATVAKYRAFEVAQPARRDHATRLPAGKRAPNP